MKQIHWMAWGMLSTVLYAPGLALAEDGDGQPKEVTAVDLLPQGEVVDAHRLDVVQNRKYRLLNEIHLATGTLPADPYYKGWTASLGYTFHFTDFFAWEVGRFTYSYNVDTSLKREVDRIARGYGAADGQPTAFPEITWIASSHAILKPLYGKQALFNTEVVHIEAFLSGGVVFMEMAGLLSGDPIAPFTNGYAAGFDVGGGLRFWFGDATSVRLDVGEMFYARTDALSTVSFSKALHLHLGVAFNLRGEDDL